jgi:hypothetical protein
MRWRGVKEDQGNKHGYPDGAICPVKHIHGFVLSFRVSGRPYPHLTHIMKFYCVRV